MEAQTSAIKPIEGKVASILNERELAVNVGTEHGVKIGMKFRVLADKPADVLDPETNESLGKLDREKVRLQVVEAHQKFSVCRTYRKKYFGGGFDVASVVGLFSSPRRELPETLKAEDLALPAPLSEEESYVKRGDRVVQLLRDDD